MAAKERKRGAKKELPQNLSGRRLGEGGKAQKVQKNTERLRIKRKVIAIISPGLAREFSPTLPASCFDFFAIFALFCG
jgi:hypothetical protein